MTCRHTHTHTQSINTMCASILTRYRGYWSLERRKSSSRRARDSLPRPQIDPTISGLRFCVIKTQKGALCIWLVGWIDGCCGGWDPVPLGVKLPELLCAGRDMGARKVAEEVSGEDPGIYRMYY
jgi:hypothetical protein